MRMETKGFAILRSCSATRPGLHVINILSIGVRVIERRLKGLLLSVTESSLTESSTEKTPPTTSRCTRTSLRGFGPLYENWSISRDNCGLFYVSYYLIDNY